MATTGTMASTVTLTITTLDFDAIGAYNGTMPRTNLTQNDLQKYDLPLETWVTHDVPATKLPATAATDDLGCTGTTFGTDSIYLITLDEKNNAGAHSVYGRTTFRLPPEYVSGETFQLAFYASANTTAASTSMVIDCEVHKLDQDGTVGADICQTAAIDINGGTTPAVRTFTINPSGLVAGDKFDIRVTITTNDTATVTAVKGIITDAYALCDIQG